MKRVYLTVICLKVNLDNTSSFMPDQSLQNKQAEYLCTTFTMRSTQYAYFIAWTAEFRTLTAEYITRTVECIAWIAEFIAWIAECIAWIAEFVAWTTECKT